MEHDAIVIGGGAAGCVVARELADRGWSVLLVEAGPGRADSPPLTTIDATAALARSERFWPGSVALTAAGGEVEYRQGRGLGGGTTVNTLVAMVGDTDDYDRWEQDHGCSGWSWSTMSPWIGTAVATWPAETAEPGPLAEAVGAAAAAAGHPQGTSSTQPDLRGFAPATLMVAEGRRRSMVEARLDGAPAALAVETGTAVARIRARGGSVSGVELADGRSFTAGRVVVTAGALHTPRLLAASGLLSSPAVGLAVQDHPSFVFTVELDPRQHRDLQARPPITAILRWSTDQDRKAPADATALVMEHVGADPDGRRYGAVIVQLTATESRGRLDPTGSGPVRFEPGWLATVGDRERFRAAVGHAADLLARPELGAVARRIAVDAEGTDLDTLRRMAPDDLDRWLITHPGPVSHAASTCPLGPDPERGAVVGLDGAVFGQHGLYVADASVLPRLPGANPQVPVMAVAQRLAAAIT